MGCGPSAPQDVDILPIKPHCRTAFARCSTADKALLNGHTLERHVGQQQEADGHDVVLCYPLGGTVFGLELQARYEKMDSVSLWTLDHFLSAPGTPLHAQKSMSGGVCSSSQLAPLLGPEIKPVPEEAGDGASLPTQLLAREIRLCRRGVVVLITAGSTWDEGVLTCLRLAGRFLRPLVMVHCVQSCPLPALEEWPPDVRPLIAASGPPVKYLSQHSAEALRHLEQRMLAAATAVAAGVAVAAGQQATAAAPTAPVAAPNGNCGCAPAPKPQIVLTLQPPAPGQQQQQQAPLQPGIQGQAKQAQAHQPQPPPDAASAASSPGPPVSLAALQASDSDVSRRAAQLMSPWVRALGSRGSSSADGLSSSPSITRSDSPITTTLVEPILVSPTRGTTPTPDAQRLSAGYQASGGTARQVPMLKAARTDASVRVGPQQPQQQQKPQSRNPQQQQDGERAGVGQDGSTRSRAGRPSECRCVLRFRDRRWASACAFLCAQLELDLGRSNVGLHGAPACSGAAAILSVAPASPSAATGIAAGSRSGRESPGLGPGTVPAGASPLGRPGGAARDSWGRQPGEPHGEKHAHAHASQQPQQPKSSSATGPVGSHQPHHGQNPHPHHHQHHQRRLDTSVPMDVALAAAGTFLPLSARASSRSSSGRCSAGSGDCISGSSTGGGGSVPAGPAGGNSGGGGRADLTTTTTTIATLSSGSNLTASTASPVGAGARHQHHQHQHHQRRGSNEEELMELSAPDVTDVCNNALAVASASSCAPAGHLGSGAASAAGPGSAGVLPRSDLRTRSWAAAALEPATATAAVTAAAAASAAALESDPHSALVYFVSPGVSAPAGCLEEVGGALARGRRVQLVVDGECCQRLPDYAPGGLTEEGWKAVKKLWHERLLYVADYHMAFCSLLKQGLATAAASRR